MMTNALGRHQKQTAHHLRRYSMFQRIRFATMGLIAVLILCFALPVSAQVMTVRTTFKNDVSPRLSEMAAMAAATQKAPETDVEKEAEPVRFVPKGIGPIPATGPDTSLQTSAYQPSAELAPTLGFAFDGLGQGFNGFNPPTNAPNAAPPDTNGAVGLTQYVQWVNSSFVVFDKSNGAVLLGPLRGNTLWTGFGGGCETNNNGDPIVTYDRMANRWVFSQFSVTGGPPFLQCIAVSTSPDATGSYNRYSAPTPSFNDYPKMGVWPDAYYETFNLFNGNTFVGGMVCAYDRGAMLGNLAATQICFTINNDGSFLPSDFDGTTLPPRGSPNYVMSTFDTNNMELRKFHVDFTTPSNSTFTDPPTLIPVTPYNFLCGGGTCVTQPVVGGHINQVLDSLGTRPMYRAAYRNFGNHESIVFTHSVAPNAGGGGVRWYEIQNLTGVPFVAQQSTFAPTTDFRWMGSIAMDRLGNMAMGYSVSSSTISPSIAITGRLASDPASTMQTEVVVQAGTGTQADFTGGRALSRWGDYSAMQIDPSDDCTFWYTSEYMKTTGIFNWNTRIASAKFSNCNAVVPPPPAALRFIPVTPCRVADTRTTQPFTGSFGPPFIRANTFTNITIPASSCSIPTTAQAYSLNVTVVPRGPLGFLTTFPCGQPLPVASTLNSIDSRAKAVAAIVPAGTNGDVCFYASDDTELVLDIDGYFVPVGTPNSLAFYPLPPCRLVDTRPPFGFTGAFGPPALVGGGAGSTPTRDFPIRGQCGLPVTAQAYSLNFTTVPSTPLGYLAAWPAGQPKPTFGSVLNAVTGTPTANAAIIPAGTGGAISVFASDNTELVLDVNGYFAPPGAGGLSLYNLTPCRVLDTRNPNNTGSPLTGQLDVDVHGGPCAPPLTAQAYVLNATVVPTTGLGFLTLWPQGGSRPNASTLNAIDQFVTSNMALVPTNTGKVSAYTSSASHLILDISGYFAP
jgi:hypothetical protein